LFTIIMRTFLLILLILSGIIFVGCVMLMSPKWWLWAWIAWGWGWGDYGSKKSVESTLKNIAYVTALVFVLSALFLPYF
jgi:preprotein translocase subunit SecG